MWKVIAFYTKDSPYEDVWKEYLLPSLEKFNIPYIVKATVNTHDWRKNVAEKPQIILDALEAEECDLVVLDADARIEQYPELFDELSGSGSDYHIACHHLDWDTWYKHTGGKKELLSGTLWLKNCDEIKDMCWKWLAGAQSARWEQQALEKIIEGTHNLNVYELPLDYIYITTLPQGQKPHVIIENPIITHHQVSRVFKRRGQI